MSAMQNYFTSISVSGDCETHGHWEKEIPEFLAKRATCPVCSDEQAKKAQAETERREREMRQAEYLRHANIPPRYLKKNLETFEADDKSGKAYDLCKRYSAKFDKVVSDGISLCFCGKPGTGKTHLAIGLIHSAIHNDISAQYRTVIEMIREVKSTYSKHSERTEREVIHHYSNIRFLVLDEVGMQIGSDTEKLILSEIINNRYANVLPTVLISNLGLSELKDYLGDRIIDRMREGGGAVISFDWDSKRGSL